MREILFRAFYKGDIEKGKPLMFIQKEIDNELFFVMKEDEEFRYEFFIPFIDNDWILQQWTGLYDNTKWEQLTEKEQKAFLIKHKKAEWIGKMIFEGDVIQFEEFSLFINRKNIERQVIWNNEKALFDVKDTSFSLYNLMTVRKIKVIGNKFDNPELLEVSDVKD